MRNRWSETTGPQRRRRGGIRNFPFGPPARHMSPRLLAAKEQLHLLLFRILSFCFFWILHGLCFLGPFSHICSFLWAESFPSLLLFLGPLAFSPAQPSSLPVLSSSPQREVITWNLKPCWPCLCCGCSSLRKEGFWV